MTERQVLHILPPQPSSDGAGVKLDRYFPVAGIVALDPFLLLDAFGSEAATDYIAGFPSHPHRGFETVTYMLAGRMRHRDNAGNEGVLGPGGVQWMTAGRGIVHEEMPEQEEGEMRGFQLWVNLPARDKMRAPRYQNIEPEDIPEVHRPDGTAIRVIAGTVDGVTGAVTEIAVAPVYLDVALPAGLTFRHDLPSAHTALVQVFAGTARIGDRPIARGDLALLGDGDVAAVTAGPEGARFLLIAGQRLNEPVARYGPFVMNTKEEIMQAIADFQSGRF